MNVFAVDIDGTVATGTSGSAGVYAGDVDATVRITLTNAAGQPTLGSANITVPAPLVVQAVDGVPFAGGATVPLRNIGLAAGASRTYVLTVDVQTCVAMPPAQFVVVAKESGDFSGEGNEFTLAAESSDLLLDLVGACHLEFVNQPTSAERTRAITRVAFDPSAAAMTVELRDAGDTGRAGSTGITVTLTAARPGVNPAPGLGGTTAVATVDGLATFGPGPTLNVSAFSYTLTATSPGLADSAASNLFNVVDGRASCATGAKCGTSTNVSGQSASVSLTSGPSTGDLLLSLNAADAPSFECPDYLRAGQAVSQFLFTGGDERLGTFNFTIPGSSRPLSSYEVCWAAPYPFVNKKGLPAGVQGLKPGTSDPLYVGVLPACNLFLPPAARKPPCLLDRRMDKITKAVTLSVWATSADPWRY